MWGDLVPSKVVADDPEEPPDPLFEQVDEWRQELDVPFIDLVGRIMIAAFIGAIVLLILIVTLTP